jgi:hypothetical protein
MAYLDLHNRWFREFGTLSLFISRAAGLRHIHAGTFFLSALGLYLQVLWIDVTEITSCSGVIDRR